MTVESLDWSAIAQFLLAVAALAVTTFLIPYLRQKLGEEPYIETVRGVGYRFVDREQEA